MGSEKGSLFFETNPDWKPALKTGYPPNFKTRANLRNT